MPRPSVRIVTTSNAGTIAGIAALEAAAFGRGGLNEWHLPVIARHGRLYALEASGAVVGAASIIRDWRSDKAYLIDLVIDEKARGRGWGRLLMARVIEDLKGERVRQLELTVAPENTAVVELYTNLGFVETGRYPNEYGRGEDRLAMTLNVTHGTRGT